MASLEKDFSAIDFTHRLENAQINLATEHIFWQVEN